MLLIVCDANSWNARAQSIQPSQPAQSQGMFGNRGPVGQSRSNLTGSMVGQGTTFGTTSSTIGLSGQPLGGALTGTQGGIPGQGTTGSGIVGRNNAGTFVGNQRAGQQQTQARSTGRPQFANRPTTETGAPFGDNQLPGGGPQQARRVIRPRQEIAFRYAPRAATTIESGLSAQFRTLTTRRPEMKEVRVAVDERGMAVLSGTVDSAEASRLASILARLEPGVRDVRNELEVRAE